MYKKIKDSISKKDVNKALDDFTTTQTNLLKAETEMLKAQVANPMLAQNNAQNQGDDGGDGDGDGGGDGDGDGGGDDTN